MINLKKVNISDKPWVDPILKSTNYRGSDYTFSNLFNWSKVYGLKCDRIDNWLIIRSGGKEGSFSYPAGYGDIAVAVEAMKEYSLSLEQDHLVIYGVNEDGKVKMEAAFPDRFSYTEVRANFDYIYNRDELANLVGRKFSSKRNHISRFKENNPGWIYETITKHNLQECMDMNDKWCALNGCDSSASLKKEACAVESGFNNYFEIGLTGGLIRADGEVVAFTFGSAVTEDTFVVHVEKAFYTVQGAYPIVNQQFVMNELGAYEFVNREDDLGEEGLRKAKESYRPVEMYKRFVAKEEIK